MAMARQVGYPVVLKALGPDIVHKTEVRGIHLNLEDDGDVRHAWQDLQTRLGDRFESGLVQPMIAGGVEMLLGVVDDPTFGHVLACATGGTLTELMADSQVRLHPLTDRDATDMIERLRGARLLDGYRGQAPADRSALRDALLRLSTLVTICPEISELDINPFVVLEAGGCALDVRVALRPPRPRPATRRIAY